MINNTRANKSYLHKTKPLALLSAIFIATSCSTVSLKEVSSFQNIEEQRGNIVTRDKLSDNTLSKLYTAGIDDKACLAQFESCINQLNKNINDNPSKQSLALLAEVHLAKAKSIKEITICNNELTRPPIDPYYANAPLSEEEVKARKIKAEQCDIDYRKNLIEAIKASYAYLFYDKLKANSPNIQSTLNKQTNKAKYLPTETDIQTQDIYEYSIDALIKLLYSEQTKSDKNVDISFYDDSLKGIKSTDNQVKLLNFKIQESLKDTESDESRTTSINIYIPREKEYISTMEQVDQNISRIYASHDLNLSGLNFISQREGVGVSYVTLLNDRKKTTVLNLIRSGADELNEPDPKKRIHRTGNLLLSGFVVPKGNTINEVLSSNTLDINLYNPHHTEIIDVLKEPYYLTANFSAGYGVWLSENNLSNVGYFNMLSKQQSMTKPQLFMLEPYNPNKRVIIMLHGLASSPSTWVSITNDIFNDEKLRDNYQVWQVFYPTNIPILENRYQIQNLIETAYKVNDPNGQHPASKHSVLIGHSMGAVISRLMLADEDLFAKIQKMDKWEQNRSLNELINKQLGKQNIKDRLTLTSLKNVDRAVFMSAPFRGTDYADQWFTLALRRIVELPIGFVQTVKGNLTSIATDGELAANPLGALYLENGASQLSGKSFFMKLTSDLDITDGVTYHSIIANEDDDITRGLAEIQLASDIQLDLSKKQNTKKENIKSQNSRSSQQDSKEEMTPIIASINVSSTISESMAKQLSDGIVPYESSHLEGAASETIISGTHSIQESPQAVITLRKILLKQLEALPKEE